MPVRPVPWLDRGRVSLTPTIRSFLVRLDDLLHRVPAPGLDRDAMSTTAAGTAALVRLPHRSDRRRDVELEIDDAKVIVVYKPERIAFTDQDEALRFVEMLCEGRVEIEVARNPLWTTMRSYRDGLALPFRRSRMPWPTLRFGVERYAVGFGT
jgi:hypothetical protein